MNNRNFWKDRPENMNKIIDFWIKHINKRPNKLLIDTCFVHDVDLFLALKDSKAVIIELFSYLLEGITDQETPHHIKKRIRGILDDEKEVYISVEEIIRLNIMSLDQLAMYQNTGLINVTPFPDLNTVGYPWKAMKELAR